MVAFLFIGVAVFAAYFALTPPSPTPPGEIVLSTADADRLRAQFRATWNRDPSVEEFRTLILGHVEEEVLYREALRFGLDQDDPIIRVRLRQKAEFLLANPGAVRAPTEAELVAHYAATRDIYTVPASVAFQQVFLGEASDDDVAAALSALQSGADPEALGQASLLPFDMAAARRSAVDGSFGTGFFAALAALPAGRWSGPVESAFGRHAVRVTGIEASAAPAFAVVRPEVERDWRRVQAEASRQAALAAIMDRYRIDLGQIEGLK